MGLASCLWLVQTVPYFVMASGHDLTFYTLVVNIVILALTIMAIVWNAVCNKTKRLRSAVLIALTKPRDRKPRLCIATTQCRSADPTSRLSTLSSVRRLTVTVVTLRLHNSSYVQIKRPYVQIDTTSVRTCLRMCA